MDEKHNFTDEALRAYVRGTLATDEVAVLEAEADSNLELAAEIALVRGIMTVATEDEASATQNSFGWARLSRAIDAEPKRGAVFSQKFALWQVAAAATIAVFGWQIAVVPLLDGPSDGFEMATGADTLEFGAQVTFFPDAPESAIREALNAAGAEFIGGPSALGIYELGFENEAARTRGIEMLSAATQVIESVLPMQ